MSASKVRAITSILVTAISEGERRRSYFWSKPREEENHSLAAAICAVILFGQPVAPHLEKEKHQPRSTELLNIGLINEEPRSTPHNTDASVMLRICITHNKLNNSANAVESVTFRKPRGRCALTTPHCSVHLHNWLGAPWTMFAREPFHSNHNLTGYQQQRAQ